MIRYFELRSEHKVEQTKHYLGLSIVKTSSIRIAATKIWVKKVDSGVLVTFKVHLRTSILGNNWQKS